VCIAQEGRAQRPGNEREFPVSYFVARLCDRRIMERERGSAGMIVPIKESQQAKTWTTAQVH
jgi:hypothetical protein